MTSLLPSIASLGLWGYWVIGLMAFFEALILTSVFSPGTVVVVLGGALAAQGLYDIFDMMWFVAVGTILGSQASFWVGTKGEALFGKGTILSTEHLDRGRRFFAKYGGASIVLGHFLGPLRPIAPVVAGLSDMRVGRFVLWNIAGGAAYTIAMVSVGYFFGTAFTLFGPSITRVGLFVGAVVLVLGLLWFVSSRIRRGWPFAVSVLRSVGTAIADNPDVRSLIVRHPRLVRFLAARLSSESFSGLPATLLGLTFLYFIGLYAELTLEFVGQGPMVAADARISALIFAFRDEALVRFFSVFTGLGQWRSIVLTALVTTLLLWVWRRRAYIPALWLVLAGNQLTVTALKAIFARPRSDLAVYAESSFSFPSGHSAAIAAFCVFVTYVLIRERIGRDILWVLLCVSLVFLVGLSRIYLNEHFLTDVLNGYVVGVLWAITGIFLAEHWQRARDRSAGTPLPGSRLRWATAAIVIALGAAEWFIVVTYTQPLRNMEPRAEVALTATVEMALKEGVLPARTENIIGTPLEPVGLILYAADDAALHALLADAGWQVSEPATIGSLSQAIVAGWLKRPFDTAPITPVFWNGWPQDFGFERPGATDNQQKRHHARFWKIPSRDPAAPHGYVGTASLDSAITWRLTHQVAPNADAERDQLVQDLLATGNVQQDGWVDLAAPSQKTDMASDPFVSDGRAAVLSMGAAASVTAD